MITNWKMDFYSIARFSQSDQLESDMEDIGKIPGWLVVMNTIHN